jgi:hypothetical protein
VGGSLDTDLADRLREVLARGDTTEAGLRELTGEADRWVRRLEAETLTSERRLRRLNADPRSPIAEIADELRLAEALRSQLREARELLDGLDERARALRTEWLLRQSEARPAP